MEWSAGDGAEVDTEDLPPARVAFEESGDEAATVASRAAALLALIRPAGSARQAFESATSEARELLGVRPIDPPAEGRFMLQEHWSSLGAAGDSALRIVHASESRSRAEEFGLPSEPDSRRRVLYEDLSSAAAFDTERVRAEQREISARVFEQAPTGPDDALRLVAASLVDRDPVIRVAAAAATLRIDPGNPVAEVVLEDVSRQDDPVAEFSRAVLASYRANETRRIEIEPAAGPPDPEPDSVLVHGTWARWGKWWRPKGDLHTYLSTEPGLFPHLYRGGSPFRWSGYFSFRAWKPGTKVDWSREQAAASFAWWAERRLIQRPDLIGHSYGGSLAMLATKAEKGIRGMILLSPAVHTTCLPDAGYYEQILHVTSKVDLVLMADHSDPRLLSGLPGVIERRVRRRGVLGHGATHQPHVWVANGLTDYIRDAWLPSLSTR
jgi:pimeloyl-ACP methyl ester carboxylesterase